MLKKIFRTKKEFKISEKDLRDPIVAVRAARTR